MKYVFLLLLLAGCNPTLTQQSVAPPGRRAQLDEVRGFWGLKHYRLNISEGVALAVTCEQTGPCEKATMISDNSNVAEVRPASWARLETTGASGRVQTPSSAFVIIGKAPGTTRMRVSTRDGERSVYVTVIDAP